MQKIVFEINNENDVRGFFHWLLYDAKVNFHPDDSFFDYVSLETSERTFSDEEATYYNTIMEKCFDVCEIEGIDIYEIANKIFEAWKN